MAVVADELILLVKSNITQAMAGLETVEAKGAGLGSKFAGAGKLAGKAVAGIGIAAIGVGVISAKVATGFEKDMAQIEALVGVPKDEMDLLSEAALSVGKNFGVGADEAAAGLFFLKSAGLETGAAIESMESAAMASAIGLGTMEDLANTATTAMTNFKMDSTEAFDSIAVAAKLAKADPAAMGKIMNENSAAAAAVKMSYGDMAGGLALLTRKFGDSNKAGTGMNGILLKMIKPSEMAKNSLADINITADEFKNMMAEDMPGALKTLNDEFAKNGVGQTEWMGKVFEGGEAIKAAGAILETEAGEIDEVFGGMANTTGAISEGWAIMEETASVKFAKMKEGVMSALIPIGLMILDVVVPALEVLVGWIGKGLEWFTNLAAGADGMKLSFGDTFGGVKDIVADLTQFISDNADDFLEIWETAKEIGMEIWEKLSAALMPLVEDLAAFIETSFGDLIDWFQENWPAIKEAVMITMEAIGVIFDFLLPRIVAVVKFYFDRIKLTITTVLDIIKGIINVFIGFVTGDWDKMWEGIKDILSAAWNYIVGIFETTLELILGLFGTSIAEWGDVWYEGWESFKEAFMDAWNGIIDGIKGFGGDIFDYIADIINGAIGNVNRLIEAMNKIPGVDIPTIPTIPTGARLAEGGTLANARGLISTRVGERGPENLMLPVGSSVSSGSGGGGLNVYIDKMVGGDPKAIAAELGWQFAVRGAA